VDSAGAFGLLGHFVVPLSSSALRRMVVGYGIAERAIHSPFRAVYWERKRLYPCSILYTTEIRRGLSYLG
jgi:hypothetical protein